MANNESEESKPPDSASWEKEGAGTVTKGLPSQAKQEAKKVLAGTMKEGSGSKRAWIQEKVIETRIYIWNLPVLRIRFKLLRVRPLKAGFPGLA